MHKRILVLGAGGFIGRSTLAALLATDWATPVAGIRRPTRTLGPEVEGRIVDATDEGSVARALAGIDAVVNCVAGDARSISDGARVLFDAATRSGATLRIVHLSTMSVYGDATGVIDESAPLRPNLGPYSVAKVIAETHAAEYPDSVILRPGCVYGPGSLQWSVRVGEWLMTHRLGDVGVNGDGYCNLVHVEDVVTAILACLKLERLEASVFNLSMASPPTWNEFLTRYGCALGAVPTRRISHRRLTLEAKLLAPPLKILELGLRAARLTALHVPPPIPPSLLRLMRQEIKLDVRRAERMLGLRWKSLETGLEETARWYAREGGLRPRERPL